MGFQDETVAFGGIAIGGKGVILYAPPIGSGVAVIAFDPYVSLGGIAHMPYPERGAKLASDSDHRIESLFNLLVAAGADASRLRVVIVGASEHLGGAEGPLSGFADRSLTSVRSDLENAGLAEIVDDTGGRFSRTCVLKVDEGQLTVDAGPAGETVFILGKGA